MSQHLQLFKDVVVRRPAISALLLAVTVPIIFTATHRALRKRRRTRALSPTSERVLILGASSGIGRALAHDYAARGARVCVVARRAQVIETVAAECDAIHDRRFPKEKGENKVLHLAGDFSVAEDMVRVRELLEREWQGVDTVIITAGVSALKPLCEIAGLTRKGDGFEPSEASAEGIHHTADVAEKAIKANYIGPLVAAVTFLPLLERTSKTPSVLLLSSLAAVLPAPTRALYCSTKAASLMLYMSLAIEHPKIKFSMHMPGTVEGDFRASAVDGGVVTEDDPDASKGLKLTEVSRSCIDAIDNGTKFVYLPANTRIGHYLYWLWPSFIEKIASKKYHWPRKQH